jgi:hypothetical protein
MKALDFSHIKLSKVKKPVDRQPTLSLNLHSMPKVWEWAMVNQNRCPTHGNRIYWKRDQSGIYCKKKGCNFYLPKATYDEIISGKRLKDYQQFNKELRK